MRGYQPVQEGDARRNMCTEVIGAWLIFATLIGSVCKKMLSEISPPESFGRDDDLIHFRESPMSAGWGMVSFLRVPVKHLMEVGDLRDEFFIKSRECRIMARLAGPLGPGGD
jgi:hypothetical protein